MTNEPEGLVQKTVEKLHMDFAIARVKGSSVDRAYGVGGFPSSFLVDARGRVVWKGHPGSFPDGMLTELLEQTSFVATLGDERFKKIDKEIGKRRYGKAHAAVVKALAKAPDDEALVKAKANIESVLAKGLERAGGLREAGDFGPAVETYDLLADEFDGLEGAVRAGAAAKEIRKDRAAKDELAAHKALRKAEALLAEGERDRAKKALERLAKKHAGTKAAERASTRLSRLH